jgi:TPR repeat protein
MRYHRASVWGQQLDVLESKIEAYKWFQLAAAQGYKGSTEACERVTLGMTREQVTEGNEGAAAFIPVQPAALKA